jgi:exopolyphosphatase/guanosine-5'-triphosphate,3'-diphosphate pyrophosphatase
MAEVVAAIDCGTNSTRLLVHDGTQSVERLMRITRLGEKVDGTKRLQPGAIERTVAVLREYREVMDRHGVTRRMIARARGRHQPRRALLTPRGGGRPELLGSREGGLSFRGPPPT